MGQMRDLAEKKKDMFLMPLDKLKVVFNVREDFSSVPERAEQLKAEGQLKPIEIRKSDTDDTAIITDGECRYRAALYANENLGCNITALWCVVEPAGVTDDTRIVRQLQHSDSTPLNQIERAKAYNILLTKYGLKQAEIARRVGKTSQHVADALALLKAPEEIQKGVVEGRMSATAATKVSRAPQKVKDQLVEKLKADEKENIRVQDVDKAVTGTASTISAKEIKKLIRKAQETQVASRKGSKEEARWAGVVHGLECALGMHEL